MMEKENCFENDIKALEDIVRKLESGECGLDESIKLYSDGVKLSEKCRKQLVKAKQKIENITAPYEETDNV